MIIEQRDAGLSQDIEWWRTRLQPRPAEVEVPLDRTRSKIYSIKRARKSFPVPPTLPALAGSTLQSIQAAVLAVLHRYSGERLLAVGSPAGLPLTVEVDPEAGLPALAEQIAAAAREAEAHPVELPELMAALDLTDAANRNPLYSVAARPAAPGETLPDLRNDVTILLSGSPLEQIEVDYSARLLHAETIDRFAGHVLLLLERGLADPALPIARIDYLSEGEKEQILRAWNATGAEFPAGATLHGLFAERAAQHPERPALLFQDRTWSYADVDRQANRIAHRLIAAGARRGDRIGLCIRPSADLLISLIGVLKTGAAVMTMDPAFPARRIGVTIEDAKPRLTLAERDLRHLVDAAPSVLVWEDLQEEIDAADTVPDTDPAAGATGEDILYILYTSGSTGRPKGVEMPHRALVNLIQWQRKQGNPDGKRTLQRTSVGFDVGFQEVFSTLCDGGTLVVATEAERADVSQLPAIAERHGIHRLFLPPVALHQMAAAAELEEHSLDALEEILVAGEQLRISLPVIRLFRSMKARLVNQYGPTETHVVTAHELTGPSTQWPALPPIGRPIDNARLYILDAHRQPVPVGIPGELYVGGAAPLARGYHDDPELTAEKFIDDPFEPGSRLYRTGDLARYHADGAIEFLGRGDDQVKLRGYRIELGDVEANLLKMPGVREAAARVHTEEDGDQRLLVYFTSQQPDVPAIPAVRAFLREQLPVHMVPSLSNLLRLPSMPLTPTGKVDRRALPAPPPARAESEDGFASITGTVQEKIGELWARALRIEKVGPGDDFMELGGHSLLAIRIVSHINEMFSITVPLPELLRSTTLSAFAGKVERLIAAKLGTERPAGAAAGKPEETAPRPALRQVELPNGRSVLAPHPQEALYLYTDVVERRTNERHGVHFNPGSTILDVGANIGLFALHALEQAPGSKVFAFEPAPILFQALKSNTQPYKSQVRLFDFGLSDRAGTAEFTYYPTLSGMSSFHADAGQERALLERILHNLSAMGNPGMGDLLSSSEEYFEHRLERETFPAKKRRLSDVFVETPELWGPIDFLKVDVQKAEMGVLRGIDDPDWPRIRQVAVEVHDFAGEAEQVAEFLRGKGYGVAIEQDALHEGSVIRFVYGWRD